MLRRDRAGPEPQRDSAFSLLEMLVALAIMSLTSLALFQSIGTMLNVSDRAVRAGEQTLEHVISRRTLSNLIDGLIPAWEDGEAGSFKGNATEFSGMSASALGARNEGITSFRLILNDNGNLGPSLRYEADGQQWVIESNLPQSSGFEYLGTDNIWRKNWPPEIKKPQDVINDIDLFRTWKLPIAIRLGSSSDKPIIISAVGRYYDMPDRMEFVYE